MGVWPGYVPLLVSHHFLQHSVLLLLLESQLLHECKLLLKLLLKLLVSDDHLLYLLVLDQARVLLDPLQGCLVLPLNLHGF